MLKKTSLSLVMLGAFVGTVEAKDEGFYVNSPKIEGIMPTGLDSSLIAYSSGGAYGMTINVTNVGRGWQNATINLNDVCRYSYSWELHPDDTKNLVSVNARDGEVSFCDATINYDANNNVIKVNRNQDIKTVKFNDSSLRALNGDRDGNYNQLMAIAGDKYVVGLKYGPDSGPGYALAIFDSNFDLLDIVKVDKKITMVKTFDDVANPSAQKIMVGFGNTLVIYGFNSNNKLTQESEYSYGSLDITDALVFTRNINGIDTMGIYFAERPTLYSRSTYGIDSSPNQGIYFTPLEYDSRTDKYTLTGSLYEVNMVGWRDWKTSNYGSNEAIYTAPFLSADGKTYVPLMSSAWYKGKSPFPKPEGYGKYLGQQASLAPSGSLENITLENEDVNTDPEKATNASLKLCTPIIMVAPMPHSLYKDADGNIIEGSRPSDYKSSAYRDMFTLGLSSSETKGSSISHSAGVFVETPDAIKKFIKFNQTFNFISQDSYSKTVSFSRGQGFYPVTTNYWNTLTLYCLIPNYAKQNYQYATGYGTTFKYANDIKTKDYPNYEMIFPQSYNSIPFYFKSDDLSKVWSSRADNGKGDWVYSDYFDGVDLKFTSDISELFAQQSELYNLKYNPLVDQSSSYQIDIGNNNGPVSASVNISEDKEKTDTFKSKTSLKLAFSTFGGEYEYSNVGTLKLSQGTTYSVSIPNADRAVIPYRGFVEILQPKDGELDLPWVSKKMKEYAGIAPPLVMSIIQPSNNMPRP